MYSPPLINTSINSSAPQTPSVDGVPGIVPQGFAKRYTCLVQLNELPISSWVPGIPKKECTRLWKGCTNWRWNWASNSDSIKRNIDRSGKRGYEVVAEDGGRYTADVVIGGADYHFIETKLLPGNYRRYSDQYWDKRLMAPELSLILCWFEPEDRRCSSSSLFFDADFDVHGERYSSKQMALGPLVLSFRFLLAG